MRATPQDLEDFAVGFSLSEGVIDSSADIDSLDIVHLDDGVELRMWLGEPPAQRLEERRRGLAGPTRRQVRRPHANRAGRRPRARIAQADHSCPWTVHDSHT